MYFAARSFTDPPGFRNSALPRIVQPVSSDALRSLISGVLPTASTKSSLIPAEKPAAWSRSPLAIDVPQVVGLIRGPARLLDDVTRRTKPACRRRPYCTLRLPSDLLDSLRTAMHSATSRPAGRYDVAVVGGGHNGLVCAAYLAAANLRVVVLEKHSRVGGAAVTEEFHPGFRNSMASYTVSLLQRRVIEELELAKHGLTIVP